jgi:hypothetical protein
MLCLERLIARYRWNGTTVLWGAPEVLAGGSAKKDDRSSLYDADASTYMSCTVLTKRDRGVWTVHHRDVPDWGGGGGGGGGVYGTRSL